MGAGGADGEHVFTLTRDQNGFAVHMTGNHGAISQVAFRNTLLQIRTSSLRQIGHILSPRISECGRQFPTVLRQGASAPLLKNRGLPCSRRGRIGDHQSRRI